MDRHGLWRTNEFRLSTQTAYNNSSLHSLQRRLSIRDNAFPPTPPRPPHHGRGLPCCRQPRTSRSVRSVYHAHASPAHSTKSSCHYHHNSVASSTSSPQVWSESARHGRCCRCLLVFINLHACRRIKIPHRRESQNLGAIVTLSHPSGWNSLETSVLKGQLRCYRLSVSKSTKRITRFEKRT